MRLFLKVICVEPPELMQLTVDPQDTPRELLFRVRCGEPAEALAIVREGKELSSAQTLQSAGVSDGETLHVICTRRTLRLPTSRPQVSEVASTPLTRPLTSGSVAARVRASRAAEAVAASASAAGIAVPRCVPSPESVVAAATPRSIILSRGGSAPSSLSTTTDDDDQPSSDEDDDEMDPAPSGPARPALPDPPAGALPPPTSWSDEVPDDCLQLDWAAGCSPSAGVAPCAGGREVVYAAGGLCVVHHPAAAAQRHFVGHTSSVLALCVHPDGRLVASAAAIAAEGGGSGGSGGSGVEGEVLVWDSATCELLVALRSEQPPEAAGLTFDEGGDVLACLGARAPSASPQPQRPQQLLTWHWRTATQIATVAVLHGGPCRGLAWQPAVRPAPPRLALCGRHAPLLLTPPALAAAELATFGRHGRPAGRLRALAALRNGLLVSGSSAGELQVWSTAQLLRRTQAHVGALRSIAVAPAAGDAAGDEAAGGIGFATGGDDDTIVLWDSNAVRLRRVELGAALQPMLDPLGRPITAGGSGSPAVRALAWTATGATTRATLGDGAALADALLVATPQAELLLMPVRGAGAAAPPPHPLQRPHARRRAAEPPLPTLGAAAGSRRAAPAAASAVAARGRLESGRVRAKASGEAAAPGAWLEAAARRHGVAAHPSRMEFASVGPDGYARLWRVPDGQRSAGADGGGGDGGYGGGGGGLQLAALQQLVLPCASVAFDPTGELVACGAARAPRVYVLRASDLTVVCRTSLHAEAEAEAAEAEAGAAQGAAAADGGGGGAVAVGGAAADKRRVRGGALCLRFSPSGAALAVGGGDGRLYLLDPAQGFAPLGVLALDDGEAAHPSPVTSLDWADDSAHLRSGCDAGHHMVWNAAARQPATAAEAAKHGWVSATVPTAWGADGVWPPRAAAAFVRSLDRSPEGDAVACGDAAGGLSLFRYPARAAGAGHRRYRAQGAPVEAVAFSWDDRFVLSVGRDGCTLLWRHWNEEGERELEECDSDAEEERSMRARHKQTVRADGSGGAAAEGDAEAFSVAEGKAAKGGKPQLRALPPWRRTLAQLGGGKGGGGGKGKPPEEVAKLAWVNGYRGHDCVNNVAFSRSGEAVYPAAAVVVLLALSSIDDDDGAAAAAAGTTRTGSKKARRKQRFFTGHTDDVLCLAAHPSDDVFATGQKAFHSGGKGRAAYVLVWDASQPAPTLLSRLGGVHEHAVTSVAFSADGRRVLTTGLDGAHSVAVWEWRPKGGEGEGGAAARGTLLLKAASTPREVLGVAFLLPRLTDATAPAAPTAAAATTPAAVAPASTPAETAAAASEAAATATTAGEAAPAEAAPAKRSEERIVVCGEKELRFGRASRGLTWRKAVFGAQGELQTLPCVAVNADGRVLTGTRRGDLYVWQSHALWRRLPAHKGPLHAITRCADGAADGSAFATGGADGVVLLWHASYHVLRRVDLNQLCREKLQRHGRALLTPRRGGVRVSALCWDGGGADRPSSKGQLLVGLQQNAVVRVILREGSETPSLLAQGHAGGWAEPDEADNAKRHSGGGGGGGGGGTGREWMQLRGLAEHPKEAQYATAGDDGTVRLWGLKPHALLAARRLRAAPRCLAFTPDGTQLALGCVDGSLAVLLAAPLELLLERHAEGDGGGGGSSGGAVQVVAFSPDARLLAAGAADGAIRLHAVRGSDGTAARAYRVVATCRAHSGGVTHLGWSADSSCLRSNCSERELRFWDDAGAQLMLDDDPKGKRNANLAKLEWSAAAEALYAPQTQAVHAATPPPKGQKDKKGDAAATGAVDGDDEPATSGGDALVSALACSQAAGGAAAERLVATGDEHQKLRLYRYSDCAAEGAAPSHVFTGHAGALSGVRFSHNGRYILSIGSEDLCAFVWRVGSAKGGADATAEEDEEVGSEDDDDDDSDVETGGGFQWKDKARSGGGLFDDDDDDDDDDVFVEEEAAPGEELGALKPWKAAIVGPTNPPDEDTSPPDDGLELEWVYGFRGFDTRRAALWAAPGKLVYPAAAAIVVYDVDGHSQQHFLQHTDDVLCVAAHRKRGVVASGQKSYKQNGKMKRPTIFVWSADDPAAPPLAGPLVFTGCNQRSIAMLSFDVKGKLLCSVGNDDDHIAVLWDWERGEALAHVQTSKEPLYALCALPPPKGSAAAFCAVGKGFGRIYTASKEGELDSGVPLKLAGREKAAAQLAVLSTDGVVTLGSDKGSLHQYRVDDGKAAGKPNKSAHEGPVNALAEGPSRGGGVTILSCGKDGEVRLWSDELEPLSSFPTGKGLSRALELLESSSSRDGAEGPPRLCALDWDDEAEQLVVGTRASELLVLPRSGDPVVVTRGHASKPPGAPPDDKVAAAAARAAAEAAEAAGGAESGAVRALAVAPGEAMCATGGDDACVRLWDLEGHEMLLDRPTRVAAPVSALAFDEGKLDDGSLRLAVGLSSGGWEVRTLDLSGGVQDVRVTKKAEHRHRPDDGGPARRISCLRFSPEGDLLAVGCADASIYIYECDDGRFKEQGKCKGHSSAITHIDWDEEGTVLRSNCLGHELRFWQIQSCQQISQASALRDFKWASYTVTLGWHCQGIFAGGASGSGVHGVDLSPDQTLLASADEFGLINLFRYPCVKPEARGGKPPNRVSFPGHASAALGCQWTTVEPSGGNKRRGKRGGDEWLISIGGLDLTVFQWRRV